MDTVNTSHPPQRTRFDQQQSRARRLLRDPLFHFVLLGLLIFAADYYIHPPVDDKRTISVDTNVENTLVGLFKDGQGREPTAEELLKLKNRWLQNEVYYREALALGLDQGDEMIRQRLILKMREVVRNNIVVDTPPDAELKSWFEANRRLYDVPERYDIEQLRVEDAAAAAGSSDADAMLARVRDGTLSEAEANMMRGYEGRTRENIADLFGKEFAADLLALPAETWGLVKSKGGLRVARVSKVHPAEPAKFEAEKPRILSDWKTAQTTYAAFEAIKAIRDRYAIVYPELGNRREPLPEEVRSETGSVSAPVFVPQQESVPEEP